LHKLKFKVPGKLGKTNCSAVIYVVFLRSADVAD